MNDEDLLRERLSRDLEQLADAAPPLHFARLWQDVRLRREAQLERRLALVTTLPATGLLAAGLASLLLLPGGWHGAIPCCAVAFWLGGQAFGTGSGFRAPPAGAKA